MLSPIPAQTMLFEGKRPRQRSEPLSSDQGPSKREERSPSAEDSFGLVKSPEKPAAKRQRKAPKAINTGNSTPKQISEQVKRSGSPYEDFMLPDPMIDLKTQISWPSNTDSSKSGSISSTDGPHSPRLSILQPPPVMSFFSNIPKSPSRPKTQGKKSRLTAFIEPKPFFNVNESHPNQLGLLPSSITRPGAHSLLTRRSSHLSHLENRADEDIPQLLPALGNHLPGFSDEFNFNSEGSIPQFPVDRSSKSPKSGFSSPKLKHSQSPDIDMMSMEDSKPQWASQDSKNKSPSPASTLSDNKALEETKRQPPITSSPKRTTPLGRKFNLVLR